MLLRGGLRDAEVALAAFDAVGLGVEDILIAASSWEMSDIFSVGLVTSVIGVCACLAKNAPIYVGSCVCIL